MAPGVVPTGATGQLGNVGPVIAVQPLTAPEALPEGGHGGSKAKIVAGGIHVAQFMGVHHLLNQARGVDAGRLVPNAQVRQFVAGGLRDLSVSRMGLAWGIPFPEHEEQTVWLPVPEGAVLVPVAEAMRRARKVADKHKGSRYVDRMFRPRA